MPTNDPPPLVLYKYQPFNREHVASVLVNSRVWFSCPLGFNDPFDCSPIIDMSGTDDEFRKLAWSVLERQRPDLSATDRRGLIETQVRQRTERMTDAAGCDAWRMSIERMGMLCLAERPDDQLMWGHYASRHRGICFGFDTGVSPFNQALRVAYCEVRPTFRGLERVEEKMHQMIWSALTTKPVHWKYEQEWRVFMPNHIGAMEFDPTALKVVVVGALASSEDEDWLLKVLRARRDPVRLLKCHLNPRIYQLEADRIDYDR